MFLRPLNNNRGLALIFMVLLFTAAAVASVMVISMGVKIKGIQKEGTTQQRLNEIRTALQNYYLIHYDLPDPSLTNPANSVPTTLLNLPQKYRFDSNGQMIRYDRVPAAGHMTTVQNILVDNTMVAAALVAPGPNKILDSTAPPYTNANNDDLVVAVSLEAEALKIAYHAVAVLQQAAKAYDQQFCDPSAPDPQDGTSFCTAINNDADTLFLPPVDRLNNDGSWDPGTEWYDYTEPVSETYTFVCGGANSGEWNPAGNCYAFVGSVLGVPQGSCTRTAVAPAIWYPNYAGQQRYQHCGSGNVYPDGTTVPLNDEDVVPRPITAAHPAPPVTDADMRPLERPVPLIDEVAADTNGDGIVNEFDSYVAATGGSGQGCIRYGVLTNDPSRGTASLDNCSTGTPAYDLAVASGLNLFKLGYNQNPAFPQFLDPWGNQYQWGSAASYGGLAQTASAALDQARDPHYWSFYSTGPDGAANTPDDILPADDRIDGYYVTPTIPNPIP